MDKLTQEQQQLILDFYFQCGDQKDIEAGRDLIASTPEAAKLYADLENTLTDLDHIKYEACPDNLVDLTIARLKLVATSSKVSNSGLQQLLEQEQNAPSFSTANEPAHQPSIPVAPPRKNYFLRPLFEVLAAAASIALVAGVLFPSLGLARQKSWQAACQNNMRALSAGFASFADDYRQNDPDLSEVRVKAGSPWWKIGDQGPQSRSNTRYPFMLIKGGYVDGKVFICKGNRVADPFMGQPETVTQLYDFPSHKNISYSFSLFCDKSENPLFCCRRIIASDLNPVFQKIRCDRSVYEKMDEFAKLKLNEQLKNSLSANHRGRGQNILYGDGSVRYTKTRIVNGDDIFTVIGVNVYTGRETPAGTHDIFLAP